MSRTQLLACQGPVGRSRPYRRLMPGARRVGVRDGLRGAVRNAANWSVEALENRTLLSAQSVNAALIGGPTSINGGFLPTTGTDLTGITFTTLTPAQVTAANLASYDTAILHVSGSSGMNGNVNNLSAQAKADIVSFVGSGHKLIIYNSETAAQSYSWLPYAFTTNNPGALGASGTLTDVEENTLSSLIPTDPNYVNASLLASGTDAVGDGNVFTTFDSHWCLDLTGRNANGVTGPLQAYTEYSSGTNLPGLIIYNGMDVDAMPAAAATTAAGQLRKVYVLELKQPFSPSNLPCGIAVTGINLTPMNAAHDTGATHVVTATITNQLGQPQANVHVNFTISAGPDAGNPGIINPVSGNTDAQGHVTLTFTNNGTAGTDTIGASFINGSNQTIQAAPAMVTFTVPKNNAAPVETTATNDINPACGAVLPNTPVKFTGTFTDANPADVHVAQINWGDGNVTTGAVTESNGAGTVMGTHSYTLPGTYTISFTVTDNGTPPLSNTGGPTSIAPVAGVSIDTPGNLVVDGTDCDDVIRITRANAAGTLLNVRFGNVSMGNFAPSAAGRIIVHGKGGNDYISVDASITRSAILYGDAGIDNVRGGNGNDVILGGDGDDNLFGGNGANILIGGIGADILQGGIGDDLMIGGSTPYDANQPAFIAISNEWSTGAPLATRQANLIAGTGLNSPFALGPANVLDDGAADALFGGGGSDWTLTS